MPKIEEMLPLYKEFERTYLSKIELGKEHIKNQKIAVLCLTRDSEQYLENNIEKITHLLELALDYKIILYENDSIDNTKTVLQKLADKNKNIRYYTEDNGRKKFGSVKSLERTQSLAEYRNKLLNQIKNDRNLCVYDYVMVMDLDFADFSEPGILNSFGWLSDNNSIDAIAGNSFELKKVFNEYSLWNYDSWAFRFSWWNELKNNEYIRYNPMLWFGLFIMPMGSPLLQVNSAFGGTAIYRTKKFIHGVYDGYDCEHVCFHLSLDRTYASFSLMLNPSQIMFFN